MILLAVTTDGRGECLTQTLESLSQRVEGIDGPKLIFDDSGDREYRDWLKATFTPEGFKVVPVGTERLGQDRALARVWKFLKGQSRHRFVWFQEDDFLYERDVDLREMAAVLDEHPQLAQLALLRQPWFKGEVKAGGIVERDPDEYERVTDDEGREWLEHRLWWTLNPNLFRTDLCRVVRPTGTKHEWRFSRRLCQDPEVRFGIYGNGRGSEPWVRHIGHERVGSGY